MDFVFTDKGGTTPLPPLQPQPPLPRFQIFFSGNKFTDFGGTPTLLLLGDSIIFLTPSHIIKYDWRLISVAMQYNGWLTLHN